MQEYDEKTVKAVYDLFGNYKFRIEEINDILNGVSIDRILTNRIYKVFRIAEKYKIDYDEDYDSEEELEKNIPTEKQISVYLAEDKTKLIKIFEKYKEELKSNKYAKDVLDDIDEVLYIFNKIEEIKEKYNGKFEKREPKMCYIGKIRNKEKFEGIEHVSVVKAEEFYRLQELLSKKKLEQ